MRAPQADRQAAVPCFALRLPCHGFPQLPSRSSCSHHTPYKGAGSFPPLFASAFLGFKLPVSAIFQFSLPHLGTPDVTTNVATTPTQQQALAVFLRPIEWPFELTISFLFFPIPLISGGRIRAGSGNWSLAAVWRRREGGWHHVVTPSPARCVSRASVAFLRRLRLAVP